MTIHRRNLKQGLDCKIPALLPDKYIQLDIEKEKAQRQDRYSRHYKDEVMSTHLGVSPLSLYSRTF
ncbi:hypothetical protein BOTNAR_0023g00500 [Botryotinia narcissicola]|uniref:Uncharacterized protein n=1 Tax=Botryotinia narcissicola TaxID=278944 RepID=A0A4Z1JHW2_9HELO|nr:hypothetical protein BOTNAR_0023g00500 [Botryotinia narcissicola]